MHKLRLAVLLSLGLTLPTLLRAQQTISVPTTTHPTIQSAINDASAGDTVLVTVAKIYTENLDFKGKGITVTTQNALTQGAAILDGGGAGPIVTMSGVNGGTLYGFTIQNGGKPQTTSGPQGAVYVTNSSASLQSNTFVKNFCAGINATGSTLQIIGNDMSQTLTTGCAAAEGLGSAIAMTGSLTSTSAVTLISSNSLHNNTASVSYSTGDKGGGAAINITNMPSVSIVFNTMYANTTTGYGGAFYIATTPQLYFANNLVYGNRGVSGGLDIVVPGKSVGPIIGLISNNTIADNTAVGSNAGSDIYISGNLAQYALVNNIVVGYTSGQVAVNCGTTYKDQTLTPLILDHNDFYSVPGSGNTPIGGYCSTPPTQLGNFSKDPLFVHGTAADVAGTSGNAVDFSLQSGSPAIDTGNNSAAVSAGNDIRNQPRIQDGTGIGYPIIDMGAYEAGNTGSTLLGPSTTLSLSPSSYTPASGNSVILTATIQTQFRSGTATIPTGTINFLEDYAVVGSGVITANGTSGTATFTLTNLTAGLHNLQAVYAGQGAFPPGISIDVIISATVGITTQTAVTITSSLNPSSIGQSVTFSANVASTNGVPTGQIVFSLDTNSTLCAAQTVDASGNATCSTSALTVGSHIITATYLPDTTNFASSSNSLTQIVNAAPLAASASTLTVSPLTSNFGDPVTLTARVMPVVITSPSILPTGTVAFFDSNSVHLGDATLASGVATFTTTILNGGPHSLSCTYDGDNVYSTSSCNTVITNVAAVATTITITSNANPSPATSPITFTAQLLSGTTPVAGASISFGVNSPTNAGCTFITDTQGFASCTMAGFAPGQYTIYAVYSGDASHTASSASLAQIVTIVPTSTTLIASPDTAPEGTSITLAATVSALAGLSAPAGTMTIFDGSTPLTTLPLQLVSSLLAGANIAVTNLSVGTHTLYAVYTPAPNPAGYGSGPYFTASQSQLITVIITPQTFALTTDKPAISIQTEHNGSMTLTITPVGNFVGFANLSCSSTLPAVLQCEFARPQLIVSNTATSTTLKLETDAIPNFYGALAPQHAHHKRNEELALATLLPFALLGLTRRRKKLAATIALSTLFALLSTLCLTGCSGKYPDHTPPGTYDIALTATGNANGSGTVITKTIHITLTVTP